MSRARKYLTPEQLAEVCARSDLKGALLVAHAWALIFGAMALFAIWPNPLTFVAGVLVVGGRQLGLAILMHDGAHGILMKSPRLNAFVSQWLCAYPVFSETWSYRKYHLVHHAYTQEEKDPDLSLSAPFPISTSSFRRKVIRDLTGRTAFKQRRAQVQAAMGPVDWPLEKRLRHFGRKLGPAIGVNLILLGGLTALGQWHLYFVMWLLPFMTYHQLIIRVRNIGEHAMVPFNAEEPGLNARTTLAGPLTGLLLAPYNVNYHAEHHMMMYIPCYNLKKAHDYLGRNGWHEKMVIAPSYLAMLKDALSGSDDGNQRRTPTLRAGTLPVNTSTPI